MCLFFSKKDATKKSAVAGVFWCAKVVQILHQRGTRWSDSDSDLPNGDMGLHHVSILDMIHVESCWSLEVVIWIEYQ